MCTDNDYVVRSEQLIMLSVQIVVELLDWGEKITMAEQCSAALGEIIREREYHRIVVEEVEEYCTDFVYRK